MGSLASAKHQIEILFKGSMHLVTAVLDGITHSATNWPFETTPTNALIGSVSVSIVSWVKI